MHSKKDEFPVIVIFDMIYSRHVKLMARWPHTALQKYFVAAVAKFNDVIPC
jgi:hypothetical protein